MSKAPIILAIDTSLDETSVAITKERRILTNVVFSQIEYHQKYKGVMPSLAKRLHQEKLPLIFTKALHNAYLEQKDIDVFAVTHGPGQAIALEVGISLAKDLATINKKPLIAVNHMIGHIYSAFCQNRNGLPKRTYNFPYLCLVISGGHTQLVLFKDHLSFDLLGETLDDALGEAYDKAARMLGFGYPGGPIIELLATKGDPTKYKLPVPMIHKPGLDFSYSGLKTALLYQTQKMGRLSREDACDLAASFQQSVIASLFLKLNRTLKIHKNIKRIIVAGGVSSNKKIRQAIRSKYKEQKVLFPALPSVFTDNAAMIGVAAFYYYQNKKFIEPGEIDRMPNLTY